MWPTSTEMQTRSRQKRFNFMLDLKKTCKCCHGRYTRKGRPTKKPKRPNKINCICFSSFSNEFKPGTAIYFWHVTKAKPQGKRSSGRLNRGSRSDRVTKEELSKTDYNRMKIHWKEIESGMNMGRCTSSVAFDILKLYNKQIHCKWRQGWQTLNRRRNVSQALDKIPQRSQWMIINCNQTQKYGVHGPRHSSVRMGLLSCQLQMTLYMKLEIITTWPWHIQCGSGYVTHWIHSSVSTWIILNLKLTKIL